jgi:predicted nucleic acid-binding Zn ribbon protein
MSDDTQRYRMTFKCECGNVFKKITKDPNLTSPPCPECKKKNKKTVFHRMGDGPVSAEEAKPAPAIVRKAPNVIYKCSDCNSITKLYEEVGETALTECPACESKNLVYKGHISKDISTASSIRNKAVDTTADIVMEDYKLGNLKEDVKLGESMAPRLDPVKQNLADNMFSGAARKKSFDAAKLAKRAMSGSLRDPRNYVDPVKALQPRHKPNVNFVAGDGIGAGR